MNKYYIYGVGIKSEIKLYQLEQYQGEAEDVNVHFGEIPQDILGYVADGKVSSMSPSRAWFQRRFCYFER